MHIIRLFSAVLLSFSLAGFTAVAQERVKPKGAADFGTLYEQVKSDYEAGRFGSAYEAARELTAVIAMKRAETIRAALPDAPEGYEKMPAKKGDDVRQNPMLAALAAGIGTVIEQVYKGPGGLIQVTVTADSPVIAMFNAMFGNPALLGENQEMIKYGDIMAVLETSGERKTLKIIIDNTLVESKFPKRNDEFIFAMWDQKAVDRLKEALAK
jgi:hypothetical protein